MPLACPSGVVGLEWSAIVVCEKCGSGMDGREVEYRKFRLVGRHGTCAEKG